MLGNLPHSLVLEGVVEGDRRGAGGEAGGRYMGHGRRRVNDSCGTQPPSIIHLCG